MADSGPGPSFAETISKIRTVDKIYSDGFNEYISKQKTVPGKATISVSQFDNEHDVIYDMVDINDVKELTSATYIPRGLTALNDATAMLVISTGEKLAKLPEDERPEKVIFVIISDGIENSSKEYGGESGRTKLKELTKHQEEKYNWEFVYIGANQDSTYEGSSRGISNSLNYAATSSSVKGMYSKLSNSTTRFRSAKKSTIGGASASFSINDNDSEDDLTQDIIDGKV